MAERVSATPRPQAAETRRWDLCGSAFAGRQVLYERFFAGDPRGLNASRFTSYDRRAVVERVQVFLARATHGRRDG